MATSEKQHCDPMLAVATPPPHSDDEALESNETAPAAAAAAATASSSMPRLDTDDIVDAANAAADRRAVEQQLAALEAEEDTDEDDGAAYTAATSTRTYTSPAKLEEFALLHTANMDLSKLTVLDMFDDPRCESTAFPGGTHISIRKDVSVAHLFPLPTTVDFCLSAIGTLSFRQGTARPVEDVDRTLSELRFIFESCLRLAVTGDDGDGADDEPSAYDTDDAEAVWDVADPEQGLFSLASVPGAMDLLVRCGISRLGTRLIFRYERRQGTGDDAPAPPPRLLLGLAAVRRERAHLAQSGETKACTPIMASYGKAIAAFSAAEDKLNSPFNFPDVDDLHEWLRLRNYFYMATVCSGGEVASGSDGDGEGASNDAMAETMLSYFSEARTRCQDVLERVESYHAVFRMRGISATPATVLGDSLAVKLRVKMYGGGSTSFDGTDSPMRTPPRGSRRAASAGSATADPGSPSDALTRTPTRPADRALFLAARPPITDLYRDPDTEHVGLLNIRQCCFLNAFVQFVFANPPLVAAVFAFPEPETLRAYRAAGKVHASSEDLVHERVVHRFQAVLAFLQLSATRAINPIPLLDAVSAACPIFGDGGQHDPHEFASAVFESMSVAFTNAAKADASVAEIAEAVEWFRHLRLPCRTEPFTKSQILDATKSREALPAPVEDDGKPHKFCDESTFIPAYFDSAQHSANQRALPASMTMREYQARRAACLTLPGYNTKPVSDEASAAVALENAPVDDAVVLAQTLDDYFTETVEANAAADAPSSSIVSKLRFVPAKGDELPHTLFIYAPSRVAGGDKRFDRLSVPATLNLGGYRVGDTSARRNRSFRACKKFAAATAETELETNARVAERAELALAAASTSSLAPAASAFLQAVEMDKKLALNRYLSAVSDLATDASHGEASVKHDDDFAFDLVSIIVHVGQRGDQGHYITYARSPTTQRWCVFDDSEVAELDGDEVDLDDEALQRSAYCMCYRKRLAGPSADLKVPPPARLQRVIEREDLRYQVQMAQALSSGP